MTSTTVHLLRLFIFNLWNGGVCLENPTRKHRDNTKWYQYCNYRKCKCYRGDKKRWVERHEKWNRPKHGNENPHHNHNDDQHHNHDNAQRENGSNQTLERHVAARKHVYNRQENAFYFSHQVTHLDKNVDKRNDEVQDAVHGRNDEIEELFAHLIKEHPKFMYGFKSAFEYANN